MEVVILGHVCIDRNTSERGTYVAAGGPAIFMHAALRQKLDCTITIVAPYGRDFASYAEALPMYPPQPAGEQTLQYENVTVGSARTQKACNVDVTTPVPLDDTIRARLARADVLFFTPLTPNLPVEYVRSVVSLLPERCLTVLLPQGYMRHFAPTGNVTPRAFSEAEALSPLVDAIVVSKQDAPDLEVLAATWAAAGPVVVVTTGSSGAVGFTEMERIAIPTTPVPDDEVVDSVGAGDVFSAGFGYAYAQTHDVQRAVRAGHALAGKHLREMLTSAS